MPRVLNLVRALPQFQRNTTKMCPARAARAARAQFPDLLFSATRLVKLLL